MSWVDFMLGEKVLAARVAELTDKNHHLNGQIGELKRTIDGLQAALEMRDALTGHGVLAEDYNLRGGETLHLKEMPAGALVRIRARTNCSLSIRW